MNKENNSVLLVEDNPKHMADAKRVLDKFGIMYDPVSNLADALGFFKEYGTYGVLSDVFFPLSEAGVERPSGVILCEYALEQRIPIVLCTSMYHHGPKISPINRYARKQGIPLVDSEDVEGDEEAEVKDWDKAVLELLVQQAIMENPTFSSQKEKLNTLYLEGISYSRDHPTRVTCDQIAEEAIQTLEREYPEISLSHQSVSSDVLMKLSNYTEGICQPYQINLVGWGWDE